MPDAVPDQPLVSMLGICKSFGANEVLHDVDFSIEAGHVHGLVGHNGAGKSTLIKVLAGMYADYTGQILLAGRPVRLTTPAASLAAGISVIQQEFTLVPAFTVEQNLALGRETTNRAGTLDKRAMRRQAVDLLADLGFDIPLGVPVGGLSVAHQQLTEIAKALIKQAGILVMDEPTARLAPEEREALFDVIRQLIGRRVGIVYISHFLDEVLAISDAITVLRDGVVIASRPASEFTLQELSSDITGDAGTAVQQTAAGEPRARSGEAALRIAGFGARGRPASDLEVDAGEIVGLAGLVGSGRTSLVEAICGARAHHGHITVAGREGGFASPAEAADNGVVLVPEDRKNRGLVLTSPIGENITLTALSRLLTRLGFVQAGRQRQVIRGAVDRFDIRGGDRPNSPASSLSGGNQQKVLIARVAISQPRLMILDQPTAGVDIGAKAEIYRYIKELASQGVGCIVVSDEPEELLTLADRIAVVKHGHVSAMVAPTGLTPANLLKLMSTADEATGEGERE